MLTSQDALRALLVRHRRLRSPRDLGWAAPTHRPAEVSWPSPAGLTAAPGRGRTRTFVSEELLAKTVGMSRLTYRLTETGKREPKATELEEIATLLQMTWRARAALFRRALGCQPTAMIDPPTGLVPPASFLRAPQPACVTDLAYYILSFNNEFAQAFLTTAALRRKATGRFNLMRALLLDARTRKQIVASVEWVEELTAELSESVALNRADPELQRLHSEATTDSLIGPVYEDALSYTYPDRQSKLLLSHTLPGLGLRQLTLVID